MKIELKKLSINERASEETTMFIADLYIDDVKAGYAKNDGGGGCTRYDGYDSNGRTLINKAEAYCLKLSPVLVPAGDGMEEFSIPMNLEHFIDEIVDKEANKKFNEKEKKRFAKKFAKDCITGICYGSDKGYYIRKWKISIEELLKTEKGVAAIKRVIAEIKSELKPDHRILNTNIPAEFLK